AYRRTPKCEIEPEHLTLRVNTMPTVELEIFTPRWGHNDTYLVRLERDSLQISHGPRSAKATWHDGRDPEWTGEALERILRNDAISAPAIFQDMIEHAWLEWRKGELDDARVGEELRELAEWLNKTT